MPVCLGVSFGLTSWTSSPIAGDARAARTAGTSLLSEVIGIHCTTTTERAGLLSASRCGRRLRCGPTPRLSRRCTPPRRRRTLKAAMEREQEESRRAKSPQVGDRGHQGCCASRKGAGQQRGGRPRPHSPPPDRGCAALHRALQREWEIVADSCRGAPASDVADTRRSFDGLLSNDHLFLAFGRGK